MALFHSTEEFSITLTNFPHSIIYIFSILSLTIVYIVTIHMVLKARFARGEGKPREHEREAKWDCHPNNPVLGPESTLEGHKMLQITYFLKDFEVVLGDCNNEHFKMCISNN